jgi:hypothetical protein
MCADIVVGSNARCVGYPRQPLERGPSCRKLCQVRQSSGARQAGWQNGQRRLNDLPAPAYARAPCKEESETIDRKRVRDQL